MTKDHANRILTAAKAYALASGDVRSWQQAVSSAPYVEEIKRHLAAATQAEQDAYVLLEILVHNTVT